MYYAVEYSCEIDGSSNIWITPGITSDVENLYKITNNIQGYSFVQEANNWRMFYDSITGAYVYKLKTMECIRIKNDSIIFNSNFSDRYYQFVPKFESYSLETSEVISLHNLLPQLQINIKRTFKEGTYNIRNFRSPISPWKLNIKEGLCTTP